MHMQQSGTRTYRMVITGRWRDGRDAAVLQLRVKVASGLQIGLVWREAVKKAVSEKGQFRSEFYKSPSPFSCLTASPWANLGFLWPLPLPGHLVSHIIMAIPSSSDELPNSGDSSFPEPTTSAYVGESGLPQ